MKKVLRMLALVALAAGLASCDYWNEDWYKNGESEQVTVPDTSATTTTDTSATTTTDTSATTTTDTPAPRTPTVTGITINGPDSVTQYSSNNAYSLTVTPAGASGTAVWYVSNYGGFSLDPSAPTGDFVDRLEADLNATVYFYTTTPVSNNFTVTVGSVTETKTVATN